MSGSANSLTYDFLPALLALDPHHAYTTTPLSGGAINLTVRVHISSAAETHECVFGGAQTVIAKYAPAYVAEVGESAPFSQYRQVIEARALALLSQPVPSAYIQATVTTPKFIYHDPASHVLLISDLGELPTLDQWLCLESTSNEAAESAGTRFGEFLVRLSGIPGHICQGQESLDLATHFSNPSTQSYYLTFTVHSFASNLLRCGVSPAEARQLVDIYLEMHERRQQPGRNKVFGLGDCWQKSVLVGRNGELSVIDWEFAGMVEPLFDLTELCANLFTLHPTSILARPKIKSFALALLRSHYTYSQPSSAWHYALEHRVDAWRLFGRCVVNSAPESDWWNRGEPRENAEAGPLGKMGAEFVKSAEIRGVNEGVLFEKVFEELK